MKAIKQRLSVIRHPARRLVLLRATTTALAMWTVTAGAMELDVGDPDIRVRWDNAIKYSNAFRMTEQSQAVLGTYNPNLDDGDRNFGRGLISNRLDLLSEFDVVYKNSVGLRLSAAGWYDAAYNRSNDNPGLSGGAVPNSTSVAANSFTDATRHLHGGGVELLDAFVFGKTEIGGSQISGRLGRHALIWGESLFFGANGIAAGQASIDLVKLLSVPGSQFKEVIRPTNQLSGSAQLAPNLSVSAYAQFNWEANRIPAAGSYFSRSDIFMDGGERLLLPPAQGGPVPRAADIRPSNGGQGGVQLRWRHSDSDTDFGFYATRYHDKDFRVYLRPGRSYALVFPEGVNAFGASFSKSLDSVNVAGEVSVRRNTPLVRALIVDAAAAGDNSGNPLYPVGNSAHAQISVVHTLERTAIWDGGLVLAELAWNRRTSMTRNASALDPNTTRDAWAFRIQATPIFYQVMPGVDLSLPIGLGYNPQGRSSVVTLFNGGSEKGGDFNIGIGFDYQQTWKGGLTLTHYIGQAGAVLDSTGNFSFLQSLKDRNFVSFSLQRTF